MPLKNCTVDGKSGYQWGDDGKCYTGKDGKKKALRQGVAVEGPEKFSEYMKGRGEELSEAEIKKYKGRGPLYIIYNARLNRYPALRCGGLY